MRHSSVPIIAAGSLQLVYWQVLLGSGVIGAGGSRTCRSEERQLSDECSALRQSLSVKSR
jgi:hypothetical protein